MKIVKNICIIFFVSCVLAAANFAINPHRPDLSLKPDEITLSQKERLQENLIIVDARNERDFAKGRFWPGAGRRPCGHAQLVGLRRPHV